MKLNELFKNVPDIEIKSMMADSRKKRPDSIFFCTKGMRYDGHQFINQAVENGAKVIVYSEALDHFRNDVTYIKVKDVTAAFNQTANAFYGYPSSQLMMFGVTGTNGKTSVAHFIREVLNHFMPTGYIGSANIVYGNVKLPSIFETPQIDDLHGMLKDMVDAGMKACTLEASSIGLEQKRVDTIDFDVAVFTNLVKDHMDYHGTMANYFNAKKKLFDNLKTDAVAITNVDDPYGLQIVKDCPCKVYTYGIDHEADYQVVSYQLLKDRTRMTLKIANIEYEIETNLIAKFNIYNLLAAIAALNLKGLRVDDMLPYLKNFTTIDGRMQRIQDGQPFNILVDVASSPYGIEKVCEYASAITPKGKRIIAVTGSEGNRETLKRPIFGKIMDKYCDMIILTEDDPRKEKIRAICNDIAEGIVSKNFIIISSRKDAIREAIELAEPNDTIILLGKGAEKFLIRDFGKEQYDGDAAVAHQMLKEYYFTNSEEGEEEEYEAE